MNKYNIFWVNCLFKKLLDEISQFLPILGKMTTLNKILYNTASIYFGIKHNSPSYLCYSTEVYILYCMYSPCNDNLSTM